MKISLANMLGFGTIVMWSLTSAVLALTGEVPPFLVGAFSFLTAFVLTAAWWGYRGESIAKKFKMPLRSYALGICGMLIYNTIYIYAFKTGPSLEVNLLNYLWPAILIICGIFLQKKTPDAYVICGILLCLSGCFFVFESRGPIHFSGDHFMLFLGVLCAVLWGGYSVLSKYVGITADQIGIFLLMTGVAMLALHLLFEETIWPSNLLGWTMLCLYALARMAFFTWDYALKHGRTEIVASVSYFIPLFSTLSLSLVGKVTYNYHLFLGAFFIVTGCVVVNFKALHRGIISWKAGAP